MHVFSRAKPQRFVVGLYPHLLLRPWANGPHPHDIRWQVWLADTLAWSSRRAWIPDTTVRMRLECMDGRKPVREDLAPCLRAIRSFFQVAGPSRSEARTRQPAVFLDLLGLASLDLDQPRPGGLMGAKAFGQCRGEPRLHEAWRGQWWPPVAGQWRSSNTERKTGWQGGGEASEVAPKGSEVHRMRQEVMERVSRQKAVPWRSLRRLHRAKPPRSS